MYDEARSVGFSLMGAINRNYEPRVSMLNYDKQFVEREREAERPPSSEKLIQEKVAFAQASRDSIISSLHRGYLHPGQCHLHIV